MQIGSLNGHQSGIVYSTDGIAPTLPAFTHGYALGGVLICSMRGRDKDNPKFRGKSNGNFAQTLEVREDQSVTNTITTVQKDNLLLEIQEEPEIVFKGGCDLTTDRPELMNIQSCMAARYDAGICRHRKEHTGVIEVYGISEDKTGNEARLD